MAKTIKRETLSQIMANNVHKTQKTLSSVSNNGQRKCPKTNKYETVTKLYQKYKTVTKTKQWRTVDVPDKNTKYETAPNTKHGKSYCPKTESTRSCSQTQTMSNHAI